MHHIFWRSMAYFVLEYWYINYCRVTLNSPLVFFSLGAKLDGVRIAQQRCSNASKIIPSLRFSTSSESEGIRWCGLPSPRKRKLWSARWILRPLNLAREGGVCAEVLVVLPDPVGAGGSDLADEGNHGALEVERDLHVEVAHAAERWWRRTSVRVISEVRQQSTS